MAHHVCPWWVGYLLANPIRRLIHNPEKILSPYIDEGMTVLEIGPGMGFFTIPAARMVGKDGKVIAVDLQEKMLQVLARRAEKAGIGSRVLARQSEPNSLGVSEPIDLCLAFYVIHEVPDQSTLFSQIKAVLKPGGRLIAAEPAGHVSEAEFQRTLTIASAGGFKQVGEPRIPRSRTALLAVD
jgi:ubiquinone/menaquinone biosynthesis C-methylase UbiE